MKQAGTYTSSRLRSKAVSQLTDDPHYVAEVPDLLSYKPANRARDKFRINEVLNFVTHLEVACSALEPAGSLVNFAFAVSLTSIFGHQSIDFSQWVVIRAHKMNRSSLNGRLSFFKCIVNV